MPFAIRFTPDEDAALLAAVVAGESKAAVCARVGCTRKILQRALRRAAREAGISVPRAHSRRLAVDVPTTVLTLVGQGITPTAAARLCTARGLPVSHESARRIVHAHRTVAGAYHPITAEGAA